MTWQQAGIALFSVAIVCEQAHVASPIVLAWTHPKLRSVALSRPIEAMLLPVLAIIGALCSPFWLIFWVYYVWNIYHFGAQHYGVLSLYLSRRKLRSDSGNLIVDRIHADSYSVGVNVANSGRSRDRFSRAVLKWTCVGGTAALMAGVPMLTDAPWWRWVALVALDFNHWLVDLGLSSRASRHWWLFLAAVLGIGCIGFAWKIPRVDHIATMAIPWVIKARWGVGIAHFLYSRWVWKGGATLIASNRRSTNMKFRIALLALSVCFGSCVASASGWTATTVSVTATFVVSEGLVISLSCANADPTSTQQAPRCDIVANAPVGTQIATVAITGLPGGYTGTPTFTDPTGAFTLQGTASPFSIVTAVSPLTQSTYPITVAATQ